MVTVSIENASNAIVTAVESTVKNVGKQMAARGTRGLNAMRNAELEVLRGERSGKVYRKPGGGTYRASAPGEPPAVRTGNLRRNWNGTVEISGNGTKHTKVTLTWESQTKYASYLEEGRGMSPRPFVKPIRDKAEPEIRRIYSEPYY